jgi:hypothetical protein
LIVVVGVCMCSAITPEGVWGRTKVWYRKAMHSVCVPLLKHAGHSLLRYPKISHSLSVVPHRVVVGVVHSTFKFERKDVGHDMR